MTTVQHVRVGPGKCACGFDTYKLDVFFPDHHELLMSHFSTMERRAFEERRHTCCYHVAAAKSVLADRERELLALKGPCSNRRCPLHFAHSGPCALAVPDTDGGEPR